MVGEVTDTLGGSIGSITSTGETPGTSSRATSATAFIGTTAAATAFFCPHGALICINPHSPDNVLSFGVTCAIQI